VKKFLILFLLCGCGTSHQTIKTHSYPKSVLDRMEKMPVFPGHLNSEGDPQTELYVPQIIGDNSFGYGSVYDFYMIGI